MLLFWLKNLMSSSRLLKLFVLKLLWPLTVHCISARRKRFNKHRSWWWCWLWCLVDVNESKLLLLLLRTQILATIFKIGMKCVIYTVRHLTLICTNVYVTWKQMWFIRIEYVTRVWHTRFVTYTVQQVSLLKYDDKI